MALVPNPSVEDLLPPFLAHIPIAFSSAQAPPSLLPLLAPILRSRVRLLAGFNDSPSTSTGLSSPSDSWLSLLTWSNTGAELCQSLSQQDFSPHPSGEFEIGEYDFKGIRRSDEEMIKARVELLERGIEVVYVWVPVKEDKEEGEGWKIVDVKLVESHVGKDEVESEGEWYPSVAAAEEGFEREVQKKRDEAQRLPIKETQLVTSPPANSHLSLQPTPAQDEDEDDSYWDMYDRSPARTPAVQHQTSVQTDDEYFARYNGVKPELDRGETPEPEGGNYHTDPAYPRYGLGSTQPQPTALRQTPPPLSSPSFSAFPAVPMPISPPTSSPSKPASIASHTPPLPIATTTVEIKAPSPRAGSPRANSPSASVSALEELAAVQNQSETGVKQHISTSIKSLFRLARVVGMERVEFERVVKTELEILGMVEEEESGGGSW